MRVTVALDERSAAFFALGIAKASAQPVAALCTSGTAAANFFPAVAEAWLSRIPLIVLTADRPRELRDVGASQTIDQVHLFGLHVKWFQDMPTPGANTPPARHAAQVAVRAVHYALSRPCGPIHINFPLREPLLPESGEASPALMGPQFAPIMTASSEALTMARGWTEQANRLVLALGPEAPAIPGAVIDTLIAKNWPIFVDPLAKTARLGGVITAYDTFLRQAFRPNRPDLVIRLGSPLTSKSFNQWAQEARLILLDWPGGFRDPDHLDSLVIEGDPGQTLKALIDLEPVKLNTYSAMIREADRDAKVRIQSVLAQSPTNFEGRFYANLQRLWGKNRGPVLVASSMPVRDLDAFYHQGDLNLYANRGANGIDGLNSTALGIARHHGDVLAVLGDLAFHHDLTGLVYAQKYALNAMIVIINNQGGAIFSYLSQSTLEPDLFEELFGTPHQIDFSGVATLYGAAYRHATDYGEFEDCFISLMEKPGLRILEWQTTERAESAAVHRQLHQSQETS